MRDEEGIYIIQAYLIRAQAREMLSQNQGALEDLKECMKLMPGSKLVKKLIDRLKNSFA